jgi:precorrin-6B methylase 2
LKNAISIYNQYKINGLEKLSIVETEYDETNNSFIHKKHIISYPYEWTANMYKDAVMFHLSLFIELDKHGIALKDAIPSNILFDFTRPIFVDFLSLVLKENLSNESWLIKSSKNADLKFSVIEQMFIPYMIIPFLAMAKKNYALARRLLSEKACNCGGGQPSWWDLYGVNDVIKAIKNLLKTLLLKDCHCFQSLAKDKKVKQYFKGHKKETDFIEFIKGGIALLKDIDVTPEKSSYVSYYEKKGEKFDVLRQLEWENKQKNVYAVLNTRKPKTVLDIGANTGWFSLLAEKMGATVIATDIDESSIDSLYLFAKENKLKILPLLVSFDDLNKEIYGNIDKDPIYINRDFKHIPLYIAGTKRFKSDMVLCLGLFHHLVLGMGKPMDQIFDILSMMTNKTLVLEFIDLEDDVIKNEPSFFRSLSNYSKDNYNIPQIIKTGNKHYDKVEIMDSHPNTRKLLIFEKTAND